VFIVIEQKSDAILRLERGEVDGGVNEMTAHVRTFNRHSIHPRMLALRNRCVMFALIGSSNQERFIKIPSCGMAVPVFHHRLLAKGTNTAAKELLFVPIVLKSNKLSSSSLYNLPVAGLTACNINASSL